MTSSEFDTRRAPEITSLTGIRGVAAMWVMVYHFSAPGGLNGHWYEPLIARGYMAVDLFFTLSGFIMALTASTQFYLDTGMSTLLKFMSRRVARVWQMYAFMTLVTFALPGGYKSVGVLFTNLIMIHAWGIAPSILGPAWSVSTEFAAYWLFPEILSLTLWNRPRNAVLIGFALIAGFAFIVTSGVFKAPNGPIDIYDTQTFGPLLRCMIEFSLGVLAFRIAQGANAKRLANLEWPVLLTSAAMLGLSLLTDTDLLLALTFPVLIVLISTNQNSVARFLGSRPIEWTGLISYSLYLVHHLPETNRPILQRFVESTGIRHTWSVTTAFAIVLSFAGAAICHYAIEKPARSWMKNILSA